MIGYQYFVIINIFIAINNKLISISFVSVLIFNKTIFIINTVRNISIRFYQPFFIFTCRSH
jgi:hypothetical protein